MLNIVLFGPPGAGKGTQSAMLIEEYELTHLSTGDLFRFNMSNKTELGVLAQKYIDEGALVPDEVTINMVADFLDRNKGSKGFIFDGFPRTTAQGEALDRLMAERDMSINSMIALDVPEEELVDRLLERGKTSGRADDQNEETIRKRFRVYKEETEPLAQYYSDQGKYMGVYGVGSIKEIFGRLCAAIEMKKA